MNAPCPAEGTLLAFLDGELPETEATRLESHLTDCDACAEALAGLRLRAGHVRGWLERHDSPPPPASAYRLPRRRFPGRAAGWAAAASVVLATAVLAGPGPAWVLDAIGLGDAPEEHVAPQVTDATSFEPAGATLTLTFERAAHARRLTIRRTDDALVTMRTPGPATELLVRPGMIEIHETDPEATDYVIELPRGVARLMIHVPGHPERVVPVGEGGDPEVVEIPAGRS